MLIKHCVFQCIVGRVGHCHYGGSGAIAMGLGIRYKVLPLVGSADKVVSIRRAFGSHGVLDADVKGSTFSNNVAWNSGGAVFALGGKTVAKASVLKVKITNSEFDQNRAVSGQGGAVKYDKGDENGDYKCFELGCDTRHTQVRIAATKFGTNSAGKAKEDNDVVGNTELEDTAAAWRHVDNFNNKQQCDASCCSTAGDKCNIPTGETTKCHSYENDWGSSYVCNDGLVLDSRLGVCWYGRTCFEVAIISRRQHHIFCALPIIDRPSAGEPGLLKTLALLEWR